MIQAGLRQTTKIYQLSSPSSGSARPSHVVSARDVARAIGSLIEQIS